MMKFRENEEAVSPVIGVILMVAITVILAAVIAAFVFGMTDNIAPQKDVYVTVTQGVTGAANDPILTVTIQGGKDVNILKDIKYTGPSVADWDSIDWSSGAASPFEVGDSGTIGGTEGSSLDTGHYIIRGEFTDGSVKILAEKDYVAPV